MTETDRQILEALDLPRRERDYRARELGMSPTRFAQRALLLLESPEAEAEYPQAVHRWRRIMAARRSWRAD